MVGDPLSLTEPGDQQHREGRLIEPADAESFATLFDRASFAFGHRLQAQDAFSMPQLEALAHRILACKDMRRFVIFDVTRGSPATKFSQLTLQDGNSASFTRLLAESCWLKLSFAQSYDPRYRRLHDRIIEETARLSGFDLPGEIGWSSMTIMVSSPGVVTPYHIDHESNLLFQIQGQKEVTVFEPWDREVLSEREIEQFYGGDIHAASYHPELRSRGWAFHLTPGRAIHNPPLGPHWVRNGCEISISVSLNFSLRHWETQARIYQANRVLRRLGLRPRPPGGPIRDKLKLAATKLVAGPRPRDLDELMRSGPRRLTRHLHF